MTLSRTADELKAAGKSAGWKLAPAAALKARSKATNRWLSTAAHFGNLHEVSRKVSASARAPDAALNRKFALTPNPDPVWLVAAAMKAVSSVSNVWLAERLTMGRPASVSQYVRRFRPCRRSDCGIVQGSSVKGQWVTPFARPDPPRGALDRAPTSLCGPQKRRTTRRKKSFSL